MLEEAPMLNKLSIGWEIPMWGILSFIFAGLFQAVILWSGQQELVKQNVTLIDEVKQMRSEMNNKSLKDVEHDIILRDHERRLQAGKL